ncbi:MAG TPA: ArsI/CadI family heavy metal resistance metalloenzyme [Burkholderiaceae bacterium]
MKRFHVHVAVEDLATSIQFYSAMFASEPSVQKTDYAKWMLDDPRINFAISQRGAQAGLNHLGIQVESGDELAQMQERLASLKPGVEKEVDVACCYAKSDKYWVNDPAGIAWETFQTLDTIPVFGADELAAKPAADKSACCIPLAQVQGKGKLPCCVPAGPEVAGSATCC